jgi:hypothetical protein
MLKPNDCIDATLQFRREVESFVKQFGLRWELEDADLPAGTDASKYAGTFAFSQKQQEQQKSDEAFDARAAQQDDTQEFANVWSEVAENNFVETDESETEEDEELIFIKETVENETAPQRSETGETEETKRGIGTEETSGEASQTLQSQSKSEPYEEVSDEGPDYLREEPPDGVEGYGEKRTEYQKIHYEIAPPNSPYTKSELMLGVKSKLFEICDGLGLNTEGTKSDLINRIFYYYDKNR